MLICWCRLYIIIKLIGTISNISNIYNKDCTDVTSGGLDHPEWNRFITILKRNIYIYIYIYIYIKNIIIYIKYIKYKNIYNTYQFHQVVSFAAFFFVSSCFEALVSGLSN